MIEINHECANTRSRTTHLYYKEKESSFDGVGIPLQVILHSFCTDDLIWFSMIYGEWDDNLLLVGLKREKAERLEKEKYIIDSPISEAFGSENAFEEYVLSSNVQKELGVILKADGGYSLSIEKDKISLGVNHNDYSISFEQDIQYQIYIHDDCFSYVKPVDKDKLRNLVNGILQQHSYYLQTEVDWSSIIDNVIQELLKSTHIRIKSHPSSKSLCVRSETYDNTRFFAFWDDIKNLISPRTKHTVSVKDGIAIW